MRVIGIDPGSRFLGWGVVDREGTRRRHVAHGVINAGKGELCERLVVIDDQLAEAIAEFAPTAGAVESIFFSKNAQSAATLGHARGVALLRLSRAGLTPAEYPPARVKRTVVGRGRADKRQVAMIVTSILSLDSVPKEDAADALAVAITHLNISRFSEQMLRTKRR